MFRPVCSYYHRQYGLVKFNVYVLKLQPKCVSVPVSERFDIVVLSIREFC